MAEIAVVDFACFNYFDGADLSEPNAEVERLAQEIYDAFTTIGFVFIKNHGIPEEEVSKFLNRNMLQIKCICKTLLTCPYNNG